MTSRVRKSKKSLVGGNGKPAASKNGRKPAAKRSAPRSRPRRAGAAAANGAAANGKVSVSSKNGKASRNGQATRNGKKNTDAQHADLSAGAPAVDGAQGDRLLIDNCLAGDVKAWERLYRRCHTPLLTTIRAFLGPAARDPNLIDEIAARVWYQLVGRGGVLLDRFDPSQDCRLSTFIAAFAKNHVRAYFRGERRRRLREAKALQTQSDSTAVPQPLTEVEVGELLETLTEREMEFCRWSMDGPSQEDGTPFSPTRNSDDQLRYRVRRKIRHFFDSK